MIICLKAISEEYFWFNNNVKSSLKFLLTLRGLSKGTQALEHSEETWAPGHSQGTQRALGHLDTQGFKTLEHLEHFGTWTLERQGTRALKTLGDLGNWTFEVLYLADSLLALSVVVTQS